MITNPLRISRDELSYHAKAFLENCKLTGKVTTITNPSSVNIHEYGTSETYDYEGAKTYIVPVHLSQDVSKKKLESLGWLKEDKDSKPLVAFIPMYRYADTDNHPEEDEGLDVWDEVVFKIKEGSIVNLYGYTENPSIADEEFSEYLIEQVEYRDDMHYYMCKLAPRRELTENRNEDDRPESGSNFINQSDD